MPNRAEDLATGPISWMARHPVTSNLIMMVMLFGGAMAMLGMKQEVFPEFSLDIVNITVPYPGTTPEEVERGIILAVEEQVRGIEGVKEMTSQAREGSARVTVELLRGADQQKVYQDIKSAIDRITSFPDDAEEPRVELLERKREVLRLIIYGDTTEKNLRNLAERVREELLSKPGITQVDLSGTREPEISVEVPLDVLRRYGLTLSEISAAIKTNALELGGGGVKSENGEVLLRLNEKRKFGADFADVPVVSLPGGGQVVLGDIAEITDDLKKNDKLSFYNGQLAVTLRIYRVGDQGPIGVSETSRALMAAIDPLLPKGVKIALWNDRSDHLVQRIDLLLRNAGMGLVLVMVMLGCFLQVRLAFWVMMGIPISFLGAFIFLPYLGVTINMISLFAFIMGLGIVVDDAIVVGENVFEWRERGMGYLEASIKGAKQVAMPVTFSILTNVVAFLPLMFVPGFVGKIFRIIPLVVGSVFIISLFEALFILPAHLAHQKHSKPGDIWSKLNRAEEFFSNLLKRFIRYRYQPVLRWCLRNRYVTLAISISVLLFVAGWIKSKRMGVQFFPKASSEKVLANFELKFGTPVAETKKIHDALVERAWAVAEEHGGRDLIRGISSNIGHNVKRRGNVIAEPGSHTTSVEVFLIPTDLRPEFSARDFSLAWRKASEDIVGVEKRLFMDDPHGPGGGDPINVRLLHSDTETLHNAAKDLAVVLGGFGGVSDIDNGFSSGKRQYDFTLTRKAHSHGLNSANVGRQIRDAYYGAVALKQQRGRDEIEVKVRLPERERESIYHFENLILRTPGGGELPLSEAVIATPTRADTDILRVDARRTCNVTADVKPASAAGQIIADLELEALPNLLEKYPGLSYSYGGDRKDLTESMSSLFGGFLVVMLVIYALLAIPFNSYSQPIIIMVSIPFGIVGAVLGHMLMGYTLSVMSMMGIVALSGVVVNDALILVDYANQLNRGGRSLGESAFRAALRRLRPIMLTSLTTFGGLAPMIFETSRQATFLIPMAISLGYGILFATLIALLLVPALYVVVDDIKKLWAGFWRWRIV